MHPSLGKVEFRISSGLEEADLFVCLCHVSLALVVLVPLESRFVRSNRGWWPSDCLFGFSVVAVKGDFSRTIVLGSFIQPNALQYSYYKSDIYSPYVSYNMSYVFTQVMCKYVWCQYVFYFFLNFYMVIMH